MRKFMQKLGKSMLIPIVAMPIAGILFRLSAGDLLDWKLFQAAGVIFANMDMLIAIGIAMGLAKTKDRGIPALTGFLAITVLNEGLTLMNPDLDMSVFGGVIAGLIAAGIYNRFKDTKLPSMFSFFGGEKFPITMIILTMIPVAGIFSLIWPYAQQGIDSFAQALVGLGAVGIFIFGFLNRFLLPFGLHHVLNTYIYFGLGSYENASGEVVTGEITRFMNGDPTAGYFLGGFFIVMIFGVPAIALAIARAAHKKKKAETKALMSSGALTSVVAGLTEPIEFTFIFTSPLLYFIHSVYTGLAGATLYLFGVRHGFSWGGSVIDYGLNLSLSDSGLMIIPIGLAFGLLYYFTFYTIIVKKNIKVIGREDDVEFGFQADEKEQSLKLSHNKFEYMAKKILENIGGKENVVDYENCMTRLRLVVKDASLVDEDKIKQTGAHGVVKVDNKHIQIIIGPEAGTVLTEFKKHIEK
ncbi:PTS acetylglucosamine transporter subunit IIB [Virgibacillus pantothenticus]|uniref:PTS acetylglucosamine transporter subunit IIB n=1 Tax=Virgibacillus pantothenticus TaxID=1473 RepID=A0A0L0QJM6_VIRPA|nr:MULTISPECIES: PTS transporter subunit EIIC [Virgibacillus]API93014.1 PTS acetylglucosamine transporter subunit IIB [Virgibacillus sp. 6R]KNE18762.1 PTS acetylglucosamine transporter subunit IIB [Virgibacillus pantothenticus]MBS7428543.1 PTS transporter subunit EIIC [Virgibacillus sp. 19R1-5]MBU8567160.1 PTS transporter subunit EIIC [Virgibacillus pantothenticus]MBU8600808.1 PTS transporter subunit EIIC [Virgibacillus pantothenticus]